MEIKKTKGGKEKQNKAEIPFFSLVGGRCHLSRGGRQGRGHGLQDGRHRWHRARLQLRVQLLVPDADLEGAGFGSLVDGGRGWDGGELLLEGRKERDRLGPVPSATAVLDRDRRHFAECWFF